LTTAVGGAYYLSVKQGLPVAAFFYGSILHRSEAGFKVLIIQNSVRKLLDMFIGDIEMQGK
jgi:hypothetical protein